MSLQELVHVVEPDRWVIVHDLSPQVNGDRVDLHGRKPSR